MCSRFKSLTILAVLVFFSALTYSGLGGCGGGGGGAPAAPTPSGAEGALELSSVADTTGVAVDSSFKNTFSAAVEASTVDESSFFLVPTPVADVSSPLKAAYDSDVCNVANAIAASVECVSSTICVLDPISNLSEATSYTACLDTTIEYADAGWSFFIREAYASANFTGASYTFTMEGTPEEEEIDYASYFDGDCDVNDGDFTYDVLVILLDAQDMDWDAECIAEETYNNSPDDVEAGCISAESLCSIDDDGLCGVSNMDCGGDGDGDDDGVEDCTSVGDEDEDGLADCFDSDCAKSPYCGASETLQDSWCSDGFDNDADKMTDCDDSECAIRDVCIIDEETTTLIASDVVSGNTSVMSTYGDFVYVWGESNPSSSINRIKISTGEKTTVLDTDDNLYIYDWCISDSGLLLVDSTSSDVYYAGHTDDSFSKVFDYETDGEGNPFYFCETDVSGAGVYTFYIANLSGIYRVVYAGGIPDSLTKEVTPGLSVDSFVYNSYDRYFEVYSGDTDGTASVWKYSVLADSWTTIISGTGRRVTTGNSNYAQGMTGDGIRWFASGTGDSRYLYKYNSASDALTQFSEYGGVYHFGMYDDILYYSAQVATSTSAILQITDQDDAGDDITIMQGTSAFTIDSEGRLYFVTNVGDSGTNDLYRMPLP